MANTKLLEREIQNLAQAGSRGGSPCTGRSAEDAAGTRFDTAMEAPRKQGLFTAELQAWFAAYFRGAGVARSLYELVINDSSLDNDRLAQNRSNILRSLIEQLSLHKLELVRASDQPTAPLPFS